MINKLNSYNFNEITDFFTEISRRMLDHEFLETLSEEREVIRFVHYDFSCVIYNHSLFEKNYYKKSILEKYLDYITYPFDKYINNFTNKNMKLDKVFEDIFLNRYKIIKPKIYNEEIAYKCGLIPFSYRLNYDKKSDKKIGLLTTGTINCDVIIKPMLDAYQALTSGTINYNKAKRIANEDRTLFEYVLGVDLTNEVIKSITNYIYEN